MHLPDISIISVDLEGQRAPAVARCVIRIGELELRGIRLVEDDGAYHAAPPRRGGHIVWPAGCDLEREITEALLAYNPVQQE
ncbi:hypothetical protein J4G48_0026775 [Bradyrhizobium barranii subsp. apii]|uniref:hypothetical protein n=1 Tax=Bradyrhizobium barranii TaxID=2992140 RepID=UPI001AA1A34C|nr:hypothetical protein [Bradyrhizobium barranii]UPT93021.1 hypothetical protein J4G48_0026775 [Bradyrhizobium barranii subsp. apii]